MHNSSHPHSDFTESFRREATCLMESITKSTEAKIEAVHSLIEGYIQNVGEKPEIYMLELLTDYILHDDLADDDPYKVERQEYPILSSRQFQRRQRGENGRQKSNMKGELPLQAAHTYSVDGVNRCYPRRRKRGIREQIYVDQKAKIKNKERAAQYKRDTAPSKVTMYHLIN